MKILDASAVLAMLFGEPGSQQVAKLLETEDCVISAVNFSEVVSRFVRDGHDAHQVSSRLSALPMQIVPFDKETATAAAELHPVTAPYGLSLADRACLATAIKLSADAVTADRVWSQLDIPIDLIR